MTGILLRRGAATEAAAPPRAKAKAKATFSRSMVLLLNAAAVGVLALNAAFLYHNDPSSSPRSSPTGGGGGGDDPADDRSPEYVIGPTYRFPSGAGHDPSNTTPPPCSLTAVFTDPRLPVFPSTDDAYARAIESVAHHTPDDACIVLQTSGCILNQQPKQQREMIPESEWFGEVGRRIYDRAHAHLRARIDAGRVRLTLLNHTKYNLESCSNFANGTLAYVNIHYLVDEFLHGVDNDLTLFFQRDTFLCRPLLVDRWKEAGYAWVGSPWRRWRGSGGPVGRMWNEQRFHIDPQRIDPPQRWSSRWDVDSWRRYWDDHGDTIDDNIRRGVEPALVELPPDVVFPNRFLSRKGVGNGGRLSLRSLKWLRRAVRVCPPPPSVSGLDQGVVDSNVCSFPWYDLDDLWISPSLMAVMDNIYYSSLMGVIGAPLPDIFDAAVFCSKCDPIGTPWIWDDSVLRGGQVLRTALDAAEGKRNETVVRYRGREGLMDFWHTAHWNNKTYVRRPSLQRSPVVVASVSIGYQQCQRCGTCPPTDLCPYSPRDVLPEPPKGGLSREWWWEWM